MYVPETTLPGPRPPGTGCSDKAASRPDAPPPHRGRLTRPSTPGYSGPIESADLGGDVSRVPPARPTPVSLDMQSARPQGVQGLLRQAGHCSAPHSSTRRGRLTAAFLQKLADTCTAVSCRAGGEMMAVTSWVVFLSVKWMEQDTLLLLSPPPQEREQRDQAPGDQDSECSEEAGWGVVSWAARGAEGRRTYLLDLSSDSSVVSSSSTCFSEVSWESSAPRGRR